MTVIAVMLATKAAATAVTAYRRILGVRRIYHICNYHANPGTDPSDLSRLAKSWMRTDLYTSGHSALRRALQIYDRLWKTAVTVTGLKLAVSELLDGVVLLLHVSAGLMLINAAGLTVVAAVELVLKVAAVLG